MANRFLLFAGLVVFMSGCASGTFKARQEQREKLAASAGMYCEFVSGDLFPDTDVELNMRMAKRCDAERNFSITNYKNSSDQVGIMYCCSMAGGGSYAIKKQARSERPVPVAAPAVAEKPAAAAAPAKSSNAQPSQKEIEEAIIGE